MAHANKAVPSQLRRELVWPMPTKLFFTTKERIDMANANNAVPLQIKRE